MPDTPTPSEHIESIGDDNQLLSVGYYWRKEFELRCNNPACRKMFCKWTLHVSSDVEPIENEEDVKKALTKAGLNIKIGHESWCRRCKDMDHKLFVAG